MIGAAAWHFVLQKDKPWSDQLKQGATHFLTELVTKADKPYDLLKTIGRSGLIDVLYKHKLLAVDSEVGIEDAEQIKKDFNDASTPALQMLAIKAWQATVRH